MRIILVLLLMVAGWLFMMENDQEQSREADPGNPDLSRIAGSRIDQKAPFRGAERDRNRGPDSQASDLSGEAVDARWNVHAHYGNTCVSSEVDSPDHRGQGF